MSARLPIHVYHDDRADHLRELILRVAPDRNVIALADRGALAAAVPEIQVLFTIIPPRDGWSAAGNLRLIQMSGAGVETLLPSPDLPAGVLIAGARGEFARETAEWAITAMLALTRDLPRIFEQQHTHQFRQFAAPTLAGRTLLLIGLGEIGTRIARTAAALEMHVLGVRAHPRATPDVAEVLSPAELDAGLARADYVILSCPRTPATEMLLDARRLALLPRGARLINVSRGGMVDEPALQSLLDAGHLAGAALDVFATEPLPADDLLRRARNLLISPHLAGLGERYLERVIAILLRNVGHLEAGEPLERLVDRGRGY